MTERIFQSVLRHPFAVVAVALLFVIAASIGIGRLVFKSDYRVYFGAENPQLTAYDAMQKIYGKSDSVVFVLSPRTGTLFTPARLEAVRQLAESSWQIPYSTRVDAVTNYQYSWAEGDDLVVEDLVSDPLALDDAGLERVRRIAISEPLLRGKLIAEDGRVTVVNVTIHLPGVNLVEEIPEVIAKVRQTQKDFLQANPDFVLYLSGMVTMNNSFVESSLHDNSTLIPVMFLIVVLTIGLLLRTLTGTFSTVLVILLSIIAAMGLAGWSGLYLTGPSAVAPTMILTLGVADCVHILTTLFYDMRHGMEKRQAILNSLRINVQPIFLTSATTAIGFLSMNFSDSPPFRDLGNIVATGVSLAFLFSVTVFPALLLLLPLKVKQVHEAPTDRMITLARWIVANRNRLLPSTALCMAALMVFAPMNETNDEFVKYLDTSVPFRQATDFMQEHLSGMTTIEVSIDSGRPSGVNDPVFLETLERFSSWLRAQPETDHVNTLSDTFKRLNRNMHGDDPAWYRLPDSQEMAAQYLLLYEMSLPYGLDLNNQLNVDKSSTRLIGTFDNLSSNEQVALEERIYAWFGRNAPHYAISVASPSLMFAHIGQRNIHSMLVGTSVALVLISTLLGFALRSVRFGLISLLPNLTPAAIGFGVWFFIDGRVGLGLSVVASMALGIIVDDTVHFLSKYLHARRKRHSAPPQAVEYAFGSVGRALWITTLVLVCGFLVLTQSTFKVTADMGLLTAVIIMIALAVDFFFLPPLLMKVDNGTDTHAKKTN